MSSVPRTTKAAVLVDYHTPLEIRELPIPPLTPDSIIVKMEAATICRTDVMIWEGGAPNIARPPMIQGHEMCGTIIALGKQRTHDVGGQPLHEGDRIVWAYPWCGKCFYCTVAGVPTMCRDTRMYGWSSINDWPGLTGGLAEYIYVRPECHVVRVPDEVDSRVAASATCSLRTVVHNLEYAGGIGIQDDVVVLGAGPVGLWSLALSVAGGAGQVIVVGAPKPRLELAKKWGARHVIDLDAEPDAAKRKEMIVALTEGRGPDVVIEASGATAAFSQAMDLVRPGGRLMIIGGAHAAHPIHAGGLLTKELHVSGTMAGAVRHYYKAIRFLKNARDRFTFQDMITNTYPLEQAYEAIQSMGAMRDIKPAVVASL